MGSVAFSVYVRETKGETATAVVKRRDVGALLGGLLNEMGK